MPPFRLCPSPLPPDPGDHALTGLAIGKMLGIAGDGTVITGPEIDAMDEKAGVKHWSIECGAVLALARQGWKRTTIKAGDKISVVVHPSKNGDPVASMMGVVTADGRALGEPLTPPTKS